jgi:hypothetical protein
MFAKCAIAVMLVSGFAAAQQADDAAGARALYYFGRADKEALPPITKASMPVRKRAGSTANTSQRPAAGQSSGPAATQPVASAPESIPDSETPAVPAPPPQAKNLGIRYNVVLVNQKTAAAQAVDPDRNFINGECFALDIEANRSGYLYVLARQSSGNWMPLFPSLDMVGETNVVNPGQKVRVPAKYCFEIADPAGTENLFVVLSRDPADVQRLNQGVRQEDDDAEPAARPKAETVQLAHARIVNGEVARLSSPTMSRDLVIRKVAEPASEQEAPNAVYVVTKAGSSRVVTEVHIRHQ